MWNPTWDIDAIVHEVVRRLRADTAAVIDRADGPSTPPSTHATNELVIDQRLVTLATIERRLKGITRMVVLPCAVVTPAVRDELNRLGIQLDRTPRGEEVPSPRKIWIGVDHEAAGENQWTALFDKAYITASRGTTTSLIEQAAKHDGPAMIVTCRVALAACLANRHKHLRAAAVRDVIEAGEAIDTMSANLLAVHAERTSRFQMRKIVELLRKTTGKKEPPIR